MPTVTGVRKELSADGTHRHIEGVCTTDRLHYTRAEVVAGLNLGQAWITRGPDGRTAAIRKLDYCPASGCLAKPYIITAPDHTTKNNLDRLPAC